MTPLTFFISVGLLAFVGLLLYGHWLQKKEEKAILKQGLQVEARIGEFKELSFELRGDLRLSLVGAVHGTKQSV